MNHEDGRTTLAPGVAALAGWLTVAVGNALEIATRPLGPFGARARLLHFAYDFGQTLAVGLLVLLLVTLFQRRFPARRLLGAAAVTAVAVAIGLVVLPEDLEGTAGRVLGRERDLRAACLILAAVAALVVPGALIVGRWWARPRLRFLPLATSMLFILVNARVLVSGYQGVHLFVAIAAATLFGAGLDGAIVPAVVTRMLAGRGRYVALGAALLLAFVSVAVPAPRTARAEQLQRDTAVVARFLQRAREPTSAVTTPPELRPWFEPRTLRADVLPSDARLVPPKGAIVLLLTIDALRAELMDPKHRGTAPNLHALARAGTNFTQARAQASDTRFSIAALFTGRHMSMSDFTWLSQMRPTLERDRVARLPELVRRGGAKTVIGVSLPSALGPRGGIVRGFDDVYLNVSADDAEPRTSKMIDHAIAMLRAQGPGPLFYFAHLMDPHAPYDRRRSTDAKSDYEAYLGEVNFVDRELGRLIGAVDELGLSPRTVLIVTADHGEAFGEHRLFHHNKPLYDVMVHVPMVIRAPLAEPRTVAAHVSLMDLGPTILDFFELPTPGYAMAESLVPLMLGRPPPAHRPIFMERPTEMAVLFQDGIKVMLRTKPHMEEIYDIRNDPREERDLRDTLVDADRWVALARAYREAHRTRDVQ